MLRRAGQSRQGHGVHHRLRACRHGRRAAGAFHPLCWPGKLLGGAIAQPRGDERHRRHDQPARRAARYRLHGDAAGIAARLRERAADPVRRHPVRHHGVHPGRPDRGPAPHPRLAAGSQAQGSRRGRRGARVMTALLAVDRLSKRFGGVQAVAELSFDVAEREILGIIGPNGAGKTTAINRLSGKDVPGLAPHVLVESGLVRTFQATTVYAARTVRENLLRGAYRQIYAGLLPALLGTPAARAARARADRHVEDIMGWLDLGRVADRTAMSLPYGFQKVLGMAIGLAASPRLILLDEPAAGLSAQETDHVRDTVRLVRSRAGCRTRCCATKP